MKKIITALCLIALTSAQAKELKLETTEGEVSLTQDVLIEKTLEFIKTHEGFRAKPYICKGGHKTIGYGFVTKYLKKEYRDSISTEQANQVLKNKLARCLKYSKETYPNLTENQLLAVAHLGYTKGFGRISKHKLHNQLLKNEVVDSIWLNFSDKEVKFESYKNNRIFELKLFKNELHSSH